MNVVFLWIAWLVMLLVAAAVAVFLEFFVAAGVIGVGAVLMMIVPILAGMDGG